MKLKNIKISGFRCYNEEIDCDFENFTAIIGKNDSGKSTILEALNIFFENQTPDKGDYSVTADQQQIKITCVFEDLPPSIIIDQAYETSFQEECLLNVHGYLEITKIYKGAAGKLSQVSIGCQHPTNENYNDLLKLNITALKTRARELEIDISGVNATIKAEIRKAIRDSNQHLVLGATNLIIFDDKSEIAKEDEKRLYNQIKTLLPLYALFKSDRESTDQDSEAQDPLKSAIKEALKSKEEELNEIAQHVQSEVTKIASETLKKLKEMDLSLANELNPIFSDSLKWDSVFKASITGDENIPFNKRGSGVKRLILLNFFRAKAEQAALKDTKQNIIYALEEPETSQHPNNQKLLIRSLLDLSSNGSAQIIITSHTPMLIREVPEESIRFIDNQQRERTIKKSTPENNQHFTKSLGILRDNNVKIFIGVEGRNDIAALKNISNLISSRNHNLLNLEKMESNGELIFFPLSGSNLALWVSRLIPLDRPEFHLYDRDTTPPELPKYHEAINTINDRENCVARCTTKLEIENYIHKEAIVAAYNANGKNLVIPRNYNEFDNVPYEVARLVHASSEATKVWEDLSDKDRKEKENNAKRIICNNASKLMTYEMLEEIDTTGECITWIQDIQRLISGTNTENAAEAA